MPVAAPGKSRVTRDISRLGARPAAGAGVGAVYCCGRGRRQADIAGSTLLVRLILGRTGVRGAVTPRSAIDEAEELVFAAAVHGELFVDLLFAGLRAVVDARRFARARIATVRCIRRALAGAIARALAGARYECLASRLAAGSAVVAEPLPGRPAIDDRSTTRVNAAREEHTYRDRVERVSRTHLDTSLAPRTLPPEARCRSWLYPF